MVALPLAMISYPISRKQVPSMPISVAVDFGVWWCSFVREVLRSPRKRRRNGRRQIFHPSRRPDRASRCRGSGRRFRANVAALERNRQHGVAHQAGLQNLQFQSCIVEPRGRSCRIDGQPTTVRMLQEVSGTQSACCTFKANSSPSPGSMGAFCF